MFSRESIASIIFILPSFLISAPDYETYSYGCFFLYVSEALRPSVYYRYIHYRLTLQIIRSFALTDSQSATSTSADSSSFVVTILLGLTWPRGISHTSFLVYAPDLRTSVTIAFGALLSTANLPSCYAFVSGFCPSRHDFAIASSLPLVSLWNLRVALRFVGNYALPGLAPQMYGMPVILYKNNS